MAKKKKNYPSNKTVEPVLSACMRPCTLTHLEKERESERERRDLMITCLEAIFIKLYNGLKEMRAPTTFDRGVSPDHLGRCSLPSSATGTAASDARQRTRRLLEASRSFGKAAAGARVHRAITLTE